VRRLAEEGQVSQYSKTSFRIWGTKLICPFDGFDRREARKIRVPLDIEEL
jgi:hypothetical protein